VSGCSPFGTLPSEWRSVPAKHATSLNPEVLSESTPPDAELLYVDIAALEGGGVSNMLTPKQLTFKAAPSRARRVLRTGDTILSTVRTYLKAVANFPSAEESLIASTGFAVLRPNGTLHPRFAYWAVLSEPFIESVVSHSEGVSYPAINPAVLGALHLPVPPSAIQLRIANFLDEQTARIDALITEKDRLLQALGEYSAATIESMFTGIYITGERTKTGSIFFPEIPASWHPAALKRLLSQPLTDGPHETPEFIPEGIPFVSAEAVKGGRVDFERKRGFISKELHELYSKKVRPQRDDVFMVKSGNTTGAVALVETDQEFSVWSPLAVMRADRERILPHFLYFALQTPYFQRSVQLFWSQGTQPNIGMGVLENLKIVVPPIPEQEVLISKAWGLRRSVAELSEHVLAHIARLREYRSSLISAAVTGQLDISTFTENLPRASS